MAIFVPAPAHWAMIFSEEYGECRLDGGNPPNTIIGGGATAIGGTIINAIAAAGGGDGPLPEAPLPLPLILNWLYESK